MDKICGIYIILNTTNDKVYVGSSKDINRRWAEHKRQLNSHKHHSVTLQRSWDKYKEDSFEFLILEECAEKDLFLREQYYMDLYQSYDSEYGYNISKESKRPDLDLYINTITGENHWSNIYSEKLILKIINDLKTGNYTYTELSRRYNVHYSVVTGIAEHKSWKHLTKNIIFPASSKEARLNVKLTENDVKEIIQLFLDGECNKNIAKMYNVADHTISDIRNHKTWTELTNGLHFKRSPNEKAYNSAQTLEQINYYRELGFSGPQISKILNISTSWIYALLKHQKENKE